MVSYYWRESWWSLVTGVSDRASGSARPRVRGKERDSQITRERESSRGSWSGIAIVSALSR